MNELLASSALLLASCGAGDDTVEGSRGVCAFGGQLTDCPDAERTPEAACWRLVDCGALNLSSTNNNRATWGTCVDDLDGLAQDRRRLVINCVAASTCDELRVGGHCLALGGR